MWAIAVWTQGSSNSEGTVPVGGVRCHSTSTRRHEKYHTCNPSHYVNKPIQIHVWMCPAYATGHKDMCDVACGCLGSPRVFLIHFVWWMRCICCVHVWVSIINIRNTITASNEMPIPKTENTWSRPRVESRCLQARRAVWVFCLSVNILMYFSALQCLHSLFIRQLLYR